MTNSHCYGHRPDPANHGMPGIDRIHHKLGAATRLPNKFSLRDSVLSGPGIMDQSITSSCVGHSIIGAIETRLKFLGTPIPHKSPLAVYDIARCTERADENPNTPINQLPALTDNGSIPSYAWKGLTDWGIPSYSDRPTIVEEVNDGPFLGQIENSITFKLDGAYRIVAIGSGLITAFKQAVFAGFPVTLAVQVDRAFEDWNPSKPPISSPNPAGILGGHYIYGIGWDTTSSGKTIVECVNSWDYSWGDNGFFFGDESFVSGWNDVYVADIHQV